MIVAAEAPLVKQFLVFLNLGHSKRLCHLLLDPEPQAANVVEQKVLIFGDLALFLRSGGGMFGWNWKPGMVFFDSLHVGACNFKAT